MSEKSSETKLIVLDALDKYKRRELDFNDNRYLKKGEVPEGTDITFATVTDEEIAAILLPENQNS